MITTVPCINIVSDLRQVRKKHHHFKKQRYNSSGSEISHNCSALFVCSLSHMHAAKLKPGQLKGSLLKVFNVEHVQTDVSDIDNPQNTDAHTAYHQKNK